MQVKSAILSTFIKLQFVIKIFVLSFFEWLLKTGLTVSYFPKYSDKYVSANSVNPDQTAPIMRLGSSLIKAHIICSLGYQST